MPLDSLHDLFVDELKDLTELDMAYLVDCTGLTNVDGLKSLTRVRQVWLHGCTGLTKETVKALRTAIPKTHVGRGFKD